MVDPRRVDQDIEPSGLLGGPSDEGSQPVVVVQIEGSNACPSASVFDGPSYFLKPFFTAACDEDVASFFGKEACYCFTDTGRSTCNNGGFAMKRGHAGLRVSMEMTNKIFWSFGQSPL
jgi:hypothetical protein